MQVAREPASGAAAYGKRVVMVRVELPLVDWLFIMLDPLWVSGDSDDGR